ncbi:pirin family protein [Sphingobium lactosutens]|jgi:redox-sensitive bicupin YhaK (pirin superfamily)|uniref:Nuclease PIN n=1 Tax=Sphingobium lactosutens DS20 TaxID=1331060 RepID=T0IZ56_9SPHN|nr:pirin family protein [Sphingobium lactosutens]EQB17170.1 nuclease PIN [Sphingobium lactosutens DS20]
MRERSVAALHPAYRDDISDLTTRRPVPGPGIAQIDPFLFLNHHGPQIYPPHNRGLPFGPHPHRGFETVTFILDGNLAHHDTGGHESVIEAGGVQWMTAGSGLIHAEVSPPSFKQIGGPLEILQLWLNLPSRLKMTSPRYTGVQAEQIPEIPIAGGVGALNLVSGTFEDQTGPIKSLTDVFMSTVRLSAGAKTALPAAAGRSVFLYVVAGTVTIGNSVVEPWHLVALNDDGDTVAIEGRTGAVLLFGHADPIAEPVVAQGPFVMNTREEIAEAVRDYQAGKFNAAGRLLDVGL